MEEILQHTNVKLLETEKEREQLRYAYFLNELAEQTKSEFIDGEIVIQSPASRKHIDISTSLTILFKLHIEKNKLGWLASEKALVHMKNAKNDYEPDICFFNTKKAIQFDGNTSIFPPPDLAIEILSKTSVKRDRQKKFKDYANHNVEEYWIIDPNKCTVEQFYLEKQGRYMLVKKYNEDDIIKSIIVKKLKFPVNAIFYFEYLDDFIFEKYNKDIDKYLNEIKLKDKQLKQNEEQLKNKNEQLKNKNEQLKNKNEQLKNKDEQLKEQAELIKNLKEQIK